MSPPREEIVHASAVSFLSQGILVCGASGTGKSGLALQLMALGAQLVGDDRLRLSKKDDGLMMSPAPNLDGLIEARGIGILNAEAIHPVRLSLAIDMDRVETQRYPPVHTKSWLDVPVPCLHNLPDTAFPAAILQYVKGGRAQV